MQGVFKKVSFSQFMQDSKKTGFVDDLTEPELIRIIWDKIQIPKKATSGSAGYDFYLPYPFFLEQGKEVTIPTGIRAEIEPGWFLMIVPRSSLGFKYGMRLLNSVAVIDSDYGFADNEGHILIKFTVDSNMCMQDGERFVQGILLQHGEAGESDTKRTGGIGSTGV